MGREWTPVVLYALSDSPQTIQRPPTRDPRNPEGEVDEERYGDRGCGHDQGAAPFFAMFTHRSAHVWWGRIDPTSLEASATAVDAASVTLPHGARDGTPLIPSLAPHQLWAPVSSNRISQRTPFSSRAQAKIPILTLRLVGVRVAHTTSFP